MNTAARTLLALLALSPLGTTLTQAAPTEPTPVVIEVSAEITDRQRSHLDWALERFEMAGLPLPTMQIAFHDSPAECDMREGYLKVTNGNIVLHECAQDPAAIRRNLVHELTHAWDLFSGDLDDATRIAFMELRDVARWFDTDDEWPHRGIEQAAEIVAWGLMERPAPIPTRVGTVGAQDEASLAEAFTTLTGVAPLWE